MSVVRSEGLHKNEKNRTMERVPNKSPDAVSQKGVSIINFAFNLPLIK